MNRRRPCPEIRTGGPVGAIELLKREREREGEEGMEREGGRERGREREMIKKEREGREGERVQITACT